VPGRCHTATVVLEVLALTRIDQVHRRSDSPASRGRPRFGAVLLAFGIGFTAGIVTIQQSFLPDDPPRATLSAPDGLDQLAVGAFMGALPRSNGLSAASRPVPAAMPVPPMPRTRDREPAAVAAAAVSPIRLAALSSDAIAMPQAQLAKRAVEPVRHAAVQVLVQSGDTLMDILIRSGIDPIDAHAAVLSLRNIYDPRRLRAGQELAIVAGGPDARNARELINLGFDLSFDHRIEVERAADGTFAATKLERPQRRETVRRAGTIDDSLYLAAQRDQVPGDLLPELVKLFSWDVDFQRDIRPGDAYELVFDAVSLEGNDAAVRGGALLYARLTLSGRELEAYRFERPDGTAEYFDRSGRSIRKFLLRTPIDGARMSSRFGMRKHPILGYSRMHKGVDFAAPTGTPIYAAGRGRIGMAGRNGGYGNYVRIDHNGDFSTAYAHLSRFARGIQRGATVRQGQVIGYVGTTGASTGPHLHYEVLKRGEQINPMNVQQPPETQLAAGELDRFRQQMERVDRIRQERSGDVLVASKGERRPSMPN
jgi:murein DD-endopeptidase MepM/ murein hydrolase activator NlpD